MKIASPLMLLVLMAVLVSGCGGGKYNIIESGPARPTVPATVIVTDFNDQRPYETRLASTKKAAPFTIYKSYHLSRPDEIFKNVDQFPTLFAKSLADNLAEGGHFSQVDYAGPEEMPERGSYDLELTGTLKESTAKGKAYFYGLVLPLGFKFSDVLWYMGFPQLTRKYDLAMDLQLYDGYTGQPIGDPIDVQYETSGKTFTVYANESKMEDLQKKIIAVWNDYIQEMHAEYPTADEQYWADLREDGQEYLRTVAREQEFMRKGSPPVFSFISPSDEASVREETATIRWSLTAPNGLKTLAMALNNEPLNTGVRSIDLADPDNAPRGISAREVQAPLRIGRNVIEARVADHRGNITDADLMIYRLPRQLNPVQRYALLIGIGSEEAQNTVDELEDVLTDPVAGQFEDNNVVALSSSDLNVDEIKEQIQQFGPMARAGELAFIYIAAPGTAETGQLGSSESPMDFEDLITAIERGTATEEVVLLLDIDWDQEAEGNTLDMIGDLPQRWAVAINSEKPTPATDRGNTLVFGQEAADIIAGDDIRSDRVTLERMLDLLVDRAAKEGAAPAITGRFNANITMAEFE